MYLDLTHTFTPDMPVFPGDPAAQLFKTSEVSRDGILHYEIKTGMHVGTHMDAPAHMVLGGKFLDEYPPEKFFGTGVIIDARGKTSAGVELLQGVNLQKGDVVLVCFGWSKAFGADEYYFNYPEIREDLAEALGRAGVSMVGMDTPSPDKAPYAVHKILFKNDVLILENLTNLEALIGKAFQVTALPAKFQAEAAPARVIAQVKQ